MNYVIVPTSELSSVDFSQVIESESSIRYSTDNSKFIVKYEDDQPTSLSGKTEYTKSEILGVVSGDEWTSSE